MANPTAHGRIVAGKLVRASPIPLYVQIEEELRGMIQGSELGPMDQVPSEVELSDRFGVSRMTARKALDRLVGDGLLFRQQGKGTFVAAPKIAHGASQQLSFSAAMNALNLTHETRVLEAASVSAPSNVARRLDLPRGSPVVFIRRLRSVGGEPAAIHLSYLPARLSALIEHDLSGSLYDLMARLGARVDQAHDSIEAVAATGEDAKLLRVSPGSPLVLISGVAYSATLEPLRYSEGLYRGDRFRFSVDTTGPANLQVEVKDRVS